VIGVRPGRIPGGQPSATLPEATAIVEAARREGDLVATWHPLGFLDVELAGGEGWSLRLHVWSTFTGDYRGVGWPIHRHDWSLQSRVLCGTLRHHVYEVEGAGPPTHRLYRIVYGGRTNVLHRTPRMVACRSVRSEPIGPGEDYALEPGIFHSVHITLGTTVATLVHAVRRPGFTNAVLGDLDGAAWYRTERPACAPSSLHAVLDLVLALLRRVGG
jgi:hypothetical protein